MQNLLNLYQSSVGKKVVMAVTGFVWVGFVVAHMLGNLHLYQGEAKMDAYGHFLRNVGHEAFGESGILWIARLVLVAAVILHIASAAQLTRMSRAARPQGYRETQSVAATYASRTMRWGGIIIALFIVYHILHLTTGHALRGFVHGRVYDNVVLGLGNPLAAGVYILASLSLGLHLYHGIWSMFQTLGMSPAAGGRDPRRIAALIVAGLVTAGNLSFPLAVLSGAVK